MPRHECWDLFVPKDRTAQSQGQADDEKQVHRKEWFGSHTKGHPQPAPAPAGEAKPH